MRALFRKIFVSKLATVFTHGYNTIPPPVRVVEVIRVADDTEGVIEVVLDDAASSSIR